MSIKIKEPLMQLHGLDLGIIGAYIVIIMAAGFAMSKLASKNLDSYFLGVANASL